jgi:hypothetical protein
LKCRRWGYSSSQQLRYRLNTLDAHAASVRPLTKDTFYAWYTSYTCHTWSPLTNDTFYAWYTSYTCHTWSPLTE